MHHRPTHVQMLGHRAQAPVRRVRRFLLRRRFDDQGGHLIPLGRLASASRSIFFNPSQSLLGESLTPSAHVTPIHPEKLGNRFILSPFRRHQDDLRPSHQPEGRSPATGPGRERLGFLFCQFDRLRYSHRTYLLKSTTLRRRISSLNYGSLHWYDHLRTVLRRRMPEEGVPWPITISRITSVSFLTEIAVGRRITVCPKKPVM